MSRLFSERAAIVLLLAALCPGAGSAASREIRYNRDVRPILSDKCFFCHGPDKKHREGKLRLDERASALQERDGVRAVVPGDPRASELIARILTTDEDDVMPPLESHKTLTDAEKETLSLWIKSGADYEEFWAYAEPKSVAIPKAKRGWPIRHEVDNFVQARLRAEGLKPSLVVNKIGLIRRVSFDLIGLPPTAAEVDAFVEDSSRDAYETVVDRLLASEAYGERMAIKWLDLVRYADTVGYHGDQSISQSPYRDYIINAFNSNMPYDQFTREQLAGDLLPNATQQQKVASAYNRMNMTTEEGGAQPKEYLAKYASDRVRNVSAIWMGATVGCAECHDHKYDPYTTKDFYSMAAFFSDLKEVGKYGARKRPPEISVFSADDLETTERAKESITLLEARLDASHPETKKAYDVWLGALRKTVVAGSAPKAVESKDVVWIDDEPLRKAKKEGEWVFVSRGQTDAQVFSGKTARRQLAKELTQHFFTVKEAGDVFSGDLFYFMVWLDPANPPKSVMLQVNDGQWEHRAYWGDSSISYGRGKGDSPAYKKMGPLPKTGEWVRLEVRADELGLKQGQSVKGLAFTQFGGLVFWDQAGVHTRGLESGEDEVQSLAKKASLTEAESRKLMSVFLAKAEELAPMRDELKSANAEVERLKKAAVTVPVSEAVEPRMMRVLTRGDWMDETGEVVQPAIPEFLGVLDTGTNRATRLDLANWFVSEGNPLTARVFMNNVWGMFFGSGISRVQEDLGGQGEWPSHLALLNWLAYDFQSHGWDVKRAVKGMVMSHTYQQASVPSDTMLTRDPQNRLLQHQTPFLLQAELVRDNALSVSGLLVHKNGGVSTRPYQPKGYYRELNFPKRKYVEDTGKNQYRRGVYTWWQRTFLHPSLKAFDAPAREACTSNRSRSNTPLQALALMNDPTYVEAARVFAVRVIKEGGADVDGRLKWAYKQALSHPADAKTLAVLKNVYESHHAQYMANTEAAAGIFDLGQSDAGRDLDAVEVAAWTSVTRVLFNLHEFITRP